MSCSCGRNDVTHAVQDENLLLQAYPKEDSLWWTHIGLAAAPDTELLLTLCKADIYLELLANVPRWQQVGVDTRSDAIAQSLEIARSM